MDFAQVITAIVTVCTLALMLIRPRGLNEAWFAAAGAGVLVLTGVLPISAPWGAIRDTASVLVFLAGMMIITGIVERAGVIEIVAERIATICGPNTRVLYIAMFLLSAVVTATMSLDITIIMMVPILYAVTKRRGLDPVPFLFACAFVANIGSLILPVSNLTNLLLVNRLDLRFGEFVRVMWLPNTVALMTTLQMFLWLFRTQLATTPIVIPADDLVPGVAAPGWRRLIGWLLMAVILALLITGFAEWPIWIPALAGAVVMLALAIGTRRIVIGQLVHDLSPAIFIFVIAMTMLVQAIEAAFLGGRKVIAPDGMGMQIVSGVIIATAASNVINNVPATVIAGEILSQLPSGPREVMAYATLLGANIGPALTTYGSLATMLWLSLLRRRGTDIRTSSYLRVSLITVPVVLLTTSIALWLSLSYL